MAVWQRLRPEGRGPLVLQTLLGPFFCKALSERPRSGPQCRLAGRYLLVVGTAALPSPGAVG